jgi:hypothetical protein
MILLTARTSRCLADRLGLLIALRLHLHGWRPRPDEGCCDQHAGEEKPDEHLEAGLEAVVESGGTRSGDIDDQTWDAGHPLDEDDLRIDGVCASR